MGLELKGTVDYTESAGEGETTYRISRLELLALRINDVSRTERSVDGRAALDDCLARGGARGPRAGADLGDSVPVRHGAYMSLSKEGG